MSSSNFIFEIRHCFELRDNRINSLGRSCQNKTRKIYQLWSYVMRMMSKITVIKKFQCKRFHFAIMNIDVKIMEEQGLKEKALKKYLDIFTFKTFTVSKQLFYISRRPFLLNFT